MPALGADDLRVRHAIYTSLAVGEKPTAAGLAAQLHVNADDVRSAFERLAAAHALVLDPQTREVWMALPFSAVPTDFRVTSGERSWFANCAWDAFGIPALLQRDAVITTSCLDCAEVLTYQVNGPMMTGGGVVHFSVPAARWWDDIGFT